ncbi:MAG: ribonuclease [Actinomycetia bacterium]|nr:ribonuclease [Actinomycetes bacterium]
MPAPARPPTDLEVRLGHGFDDDVLMRRSLTHRSYCAEHTDAASNERLEFLGDSVLGLVVTEYVHDRYPTLPEGELAKLRAGVVNAEVLAELAREVHLGEHLLLGKGEDASGGREKPSILADAMEAVIGALYLDAGWETAKRFVLELLRDRITEDAVGPGGQDFKTRLQELAARRLEQMPRYSVRSEGPDHARHFYASVRLAGETRGEGEGRSKKHAEQQAARGAWEWLVQQADQPEDVGVSVVTAEPIGSDGASNGGLDAGTT